MALEYFLEKEGLKYFSQHLDERFKNRLRYIDKLPLNPDTRVDFNDIAPVLTGAIYLLTGDEGTKATVDGIEYRPGDFIMSMKRIIKQDDGTLVDEDGNPSDVVVERLGSAGSLPDGENDGDALVFVDGKWQITDKYGYDTTMVMDKTFSVMVTGANSSQIEWFLPGFTYDEGKEYTVYLDGDLIGTGVAEASTYPPYEVYIDLVGPSGSANAWLKWDKDLNSGSYCVLNGSWSSFDFNVKHDVRITSTDPVTVRQTIDKKYLPSNAIQQISTRWLPTVADESIFYLNKNTDTRTLDGRYSFKIEYEVQGYNARYDGIFLDNVQVMTWETLTAEWAQLRDIYFESNPEGQIGTYSMSETSYGSYETIVTFVNADGSFREYPKTYYDLYCFTPVADGSTQSSRWKRIWTSQPLGETIEIGRPWMDAKLEMID